MNLLFVNEKAKVYVHVCFVSEFFNSSLTLGAFLKTLIDSSGSSQMLSSALQSYDTHPSRNVNFCPLIHEKLFYQKTLLCQLSNIRAADGNQQTTAISVFVGAATYSFSASGSIL